MQADQYFPDVPVVTYQPDAAPDNALVFRHYNPSEIVLGKPMKEWLRFSVCFWHTFAGGGGADPFGAPTLQRPWNHSDSDGDGDSSSPMDRAKRRIDAAFELLQKLQVEYYCFHDADVAPPEDDNADETTSFRDFLSGVDEIADYLLRKQRATGVRLLWATQNLFSHPRYAHGAATSPDVDAFCRAAAQVQKVMDITHKLGGLNHVFWGGREGYQTLLNTDIKKECDHMAALYRMAIQYKESKGYTAQFLLEPKPREPMKHQYDYDAQTTLCFLKEYGLEEHFKLNIEPNHTTLAGHAPEHDIAVASAYGMLGSIDSNTGDPLLGWDTDQFPMNLQDTAAIMSLVIQQGGLGTGGLNFDAKVRRESLSPRDLFIAHAGAMDCYALGLRKAAAMHEAGLMRRMLQDRYLTWSTTEMGRKIEQGQATLEECAAYAKERGEPEANSGQQELFEVVRNRFLYS